MRKIALLTVALTTTLMAQADSFKRGGQFVDYILPIHGSIAATTADWGTTPGSLKGYSWTGTLGRWKDNGIEDNTYSYWGGNALKGDDGKWHIFVAGWPENSPKGHDTWLTGSRCYHGVSDYPDRGFVWQEELGAGHNTEAYRLKDGRTVVYNIERRYISNEPTLTSSTTWTLGNFNWHLRDRRLERGNDRTVSLSNCTFARRSDGSFLMMDRGGCVWVSRDGVSDYYQQTDHTAYVGSRTRYLEDPVIWHDHMQYYMIVNDYDAKVANLSRSLDGIHWINEPGVAYQTGVIKHTNGDVEDWYKLERPKVQTDSIGRATYIHFAVVDAVKDADAGPNDGHSSKNIIAPLVKSRKMEVLNTDVITASTTNIRVRIMKEADFNPADINLSSLVFGSYDKVNHGNGFTATSSEYDADGNLVVTFTGVAGASGITADEFAPKMIGETNAGDIVYGYAKLPYVNYEPAVVSAMIPDIDADNYISTVKVDNYGLSTSTEMTVKVMTTSGAILSTGTVHAIPAYGSENVALKGLSKPSAIYDKIVVAFYKDNVEVDRNNLFVDSICNRQTSLKNLISKAEDVLANNEKYSQGRTALQAKLDEVKAKRYYFSAKIQQELNSQLETAIKECLYANGITTQSWDFYQAALQNASFAMTDKSVVTADNHNVKIADYMTIGGKQQKFHGRIAFDQGSSRLNFRNQGEGMNNTGLFNYNNDAHFSVLNLQPGDEITFGLAGKTMPTFISENCYVKGDATKTLLASGTRLASGVTYIVGGDSTTQMDIQSYNYVCITNLSVESSSAETVTTPQISNDVAFLVTIIPGESSAGTTGLTTYYTTDGTTPTRESNLYTAPFTVSKNAIVKAVTYLPNGTPSAVKSIRASIPDQEWDFTNSTLWTDSKLTADKQYDSKGDEVQAGGVLLNFESGKASFSQSGSQALWWLVSGTSEQPDKNYIQIVVPTDTKLTVNTTGWSGERCYWYTINGTTGSTGAKFATSSSDRTHEFVNTSGASQTYTIWANNQLKNGVPQTNLSSLMLTDISEIFEYKATVTAMCGDTEIDQWVLEGLPEFKEYTIQGKAYIKKADQLYVLNDDKFAYTNSQDYSYTTEMGLEDQTVTINYNRYPAGDIVFFAEAESLAGVTATASATASNGFTAHPNANKMAVLCTLPAGHYNINVGTVKDRDVHLRNAGVSDNTQNSILYWGKNENGIKSFTLTEETQLGLSGYTTSKGGLNQAGDIDFVVIHATGIDIPAQVSGYQTFSSDCALDFSETETNAYIATAVNGDKVYLQRVIKVPANTGILLKGTAEETIPVFVSGDTDNVDDNLLVRGNGGAISNDPGFDKYILASGDDGTNAGFCLVGDEPVMVGKNQAYLNIASNAHTKRLNFTFDIPTGITTVVGGNSQGTIIYNMAGQRVDKPVKGLYIINKRKVIK